MNDRGIEVIRHLNRLMNDRNLPQQVRNKVGYAVQYIMELEHEVECYGNLDILLEKTNFD